MTPEEYISWLKKEYSKGMTLDFQDLEILSPFAWREYRSAYQIYSYKRSKPLFGMAYKNVNKRIHKLLALHLIEEVCTPPKNKRHAIFYKLSELGIYQLFLNSLDSIRMNQENIQNSVSTVVNNTRQFFKNYSDSKLFECFLYPYFEKNTLIDIGSYVLWDLFEYLVHCCKRIETEIRFQYNIPAYQTKFRWNKIREDEANLKDFLKNEYGLEESSINQINIRKDVEKDEKGNSIRIRTPDGAIHMDLIEDKKVLVKASINDSFRSREYPVREMGVDLMVVEPTTYEEKLTDLINSSKKEMEHLIYRFVCKLGSSAEDYEINYYSEILSKDRKFMNMVHYLYNNNHKFFENGCIKIDYKQENR